MKTRIEELSEKIAYGVLNVEPNVKEEDLVGFDISTIIETIEMIAQIIMEVSSLCPTKSMIGVSVKKPNFMQRIRFKMLVKQSIDASGNAKLKSMSGKVATAIMDECAKLTDNEIDKVVKESESLDNWLI